MRGDSESAMYDRRMAVTGPFRCLRCGALAEIDAPGMLTLGVKHRPIDATAPQCHCGSTRWVRAGTFSEYYMYSRRNDVCRFGDHIDARAKQFRLVPREPVEAKPGVARVTELEVRVCPDHEP